MVEDYREIVPYLLHWYDYNARVLPWREERNPYHTWVSEIMLQQTRVEAVRGYYYRFLEALPDVKALAEAPEEQLLKLWEGLGYYSRVRNLQKAAQVIMREHGGSIPADYELLRSLPGIGNYTAGAIASIAYGIPVPAVDGNVLRVMKRVQGSRDDITKDAVKRQLQADLQAVIPKERPGDFNQAVMDIGATVCVPNGKPHCEDCPLVHLCRAFREESYGEIPVKPTKKERRIEERTILVIEWDGRYLLGKRPARGLLAGLWELPGADGRLTAEEVKREWLQYRGLEAEQIRRLPEAKHIFSHVEWRMSAYALKLAKHANPEKLLASGEYHFATKEEIRNRYALPSAFAAYAEQILNGMGKAEEV